MCILENYCTSYMYYPARKEFKSRVLSPLKYVVLPGFIVLISVTVTCCAECLFTQNDKYNVIRNRTNKFGNDLYKDHNKKVRFIRTKYLVCTYYTVWESFNP